MPRKIEEAEPAELPLEPILQSAPELNCSSSRPRSDKRAAKTGSGLEQLLTPKEATHFLRVSLSWLAKARMRGDGPPYIRIGRSIRYGETTLLQWMKSRQRLSTSER